MIGRGSLSAILIVALGLLSWAGSVSAVEVQGLYEVAVPVDSQDAAGRRAALRKAFAEVLLRLTEDPSALEADVLKEALRRPMGYVQQFRYRPRPPSEVEELAGEKDSTGLPAAGPAEDRQELWVSFDPEAVNALLAEAGLPVWGRARPATLLWLAVEDGGRRYLVGGDAGKAFQAALREAARQRGLPLFFPLLDLEDQAAVAFTDVWGNFQDSILRASGRYRSGAVLVGRLYHRHDGVWEGRWTLYGEGVAPEFWALADADPDAVLAAGVNGAAQRLARRYAQRLDVAAAHAETLRIRDVRTLEDYARTLRYLQSLDAIGDLRVLAVADDGLLLQAVIQGGREGLRRAITFGGTLAAVTRSGQALEGDASGPGAALEYRLLP